MTLRECKLCGKVFNSEKRKVCPNCIMRLESLYGRIHEYLRDYGDEDFDVERLAAEMEIDPRDIEELIAMGYLERDLQTYGKEKKASRQDLADAFNNELDKMRKGLTTTYGGKRYSRDPRGNDNRQYVYDSQYKR